MLRLSIFCLLCIPTLVFGQVVSGEVTDQNHSPLIGATVYWAGSSQAVSADSTGSFTLTLHPESHLLVASYVGHTPDTVSFTGQASVQFRLVATSDLDEVVISDERPGVIISNTDPIKTETITQTELTKAACCDLAGCFETQTTVQPQTTNVITNSKELRMLGLSGVYNQTLIDGLPMVQGLSYTYGISGIPGTLVDNIHVSKGANSVVQGYESISGQINVETKSPDDTDKLLLNAYINNFMEKHVNANYAMRKGKWSNLTAFHTVQPADRIDRDGDGFMDLPLLTRYMVFNRTQYGDADKNGLHSAWGVRLLHEERLGGQLDYQQGRDAGSSEVYGQSVRMTQPELWTRTGYRFNERHHVLLLASAFHHDQSSWFGPIRYQASQTNVYMNVQHEWDWNRNNLLKTGISYRHLDLREDIGFSVNTLQRTYAGAYSRLENIPGVFAENTMRLFGDKLTWIAGVRGDHHNQFGYAFTPRTLVKYDFSPNTSVRASAGIGWRTVNFFSENIGLLISSRDIVFTEELEPERAASYGLNLTHKFSGERVNGFFSADFYHTDFQNQIFPEYDIDPTLAIVENFNGRSVSNGFQAELYLEIADRLEIKTGYNFLDVYRMIEGEKALLPFNPRHRLLGVLGYRPLNRKFQCDVNMHWYGQRRMPDTGQNPEQFQGRDFSPHFAIANAQFTWYFGKVDVYGGCENIFDFRQRQPIIGWQDPFGPYFDTSSVWGPVRGREFYLGVRFRIEGKKG